MNTAIGTTCLSPRIRFKEFGGAWEARPLGDEGKTVSGVGFPEAEQGGVVGTPFFKVSDMSNPGNESVMVRANNYVSEEQIRKHSWHPVENLPAILFAKVGAAALLNRKRLVKNRFLMDNNMMAYCLNDGCNGDFFKVLFESIDLSSFVQVGALPSINGKDVESKVARFPSLPEQRRIAELFRNLDETIAATDARLEKLRLSKKSLLEKMFPRPGASVPEIRFKGFEGEWEQKRLQEIVEFNPSARLPECFEYVDLESVVGNQMIFHRRVLRKTAPSRAQRLAKRGDVFFQTVRPYQQNNYLFDLESKDAFVFSTGYAQMRGAQNSPFLLSALQSKPFLCDVLNNCTGSGYPAISDSRLSELSISIPSLAEQQRIGTFFCEFDKLIESVQKKATKLRQVKSALLEEMFV